MNILLIGGGGREHAIAWKLAQSPRLNNFFIAPGNAGTAKLGTNLPLRVPGSSADPTEIDSFISDAVAQAIGCRADLVIVAPDDPLAWGLVDRLQEAGIPAFGPTARAAEIEASKGFAKALMSRYGIAAAQGRSFDSLERAQRHLRDMAPPFVVKADGLAAGKGVTVAPTREEALGALSAIMTDQTFGRAGERVVIEEFLEGNELSVHAFSDGSFFSMMPFSRDHKRAFDGDAGPNTGGMGVVCPPPGLNRALADAIETDVVAPTIKALADEGRPFKGVLYPGLMLTGDGPRVLEFNARFGDPEAEALLPLLETDLIDIIEAVIYERLAGLDVRWSDRASVAVIMASGGYPDAYATGYPIEGLSSADSDAQVFLAAAKDDDGRTVTSGGRVLAVVAQGSTLDEARDRAYDNVQRISFEKAHYRTDIGAV
ncbi:MAG: phosphoribosylamine--glycine ligase [Dehalococcoidia bacterium]|nr:phosphoribosylamine--glycine ligase [Dehalococcoidia bacterium]